MPNNKKIEKINVEKHTTCDDKCTSNFFFKTVTTNFSNDIDKQGYSGCDSSRFNKKVQYDGFNFFSIQRADPHITRYIDIFLTDPIIRLIFLNTIALIISVVYAISR